MWALPRILNKFLSINILKMNRTLADQIATTDIFLEKRNSSVSRRSVNTRVSHMRGIIRSVIANQRSTIPQLSHRINH